MIRRVGVPELTVVTVLLFIAVPRAEACSCGGLNPPCAAVWNADAVFVGTVIDKVHEPVGGKLSWTVHNVVVTQRLHGAIDGRITLTPNNRPSAERIEASKSHTGPSFMGSSCDFDFEPGRQYIIYARKTSDGRWTTSQCTGTKLVESGAEDFAYIATIPVTEPLGRVYGTIKRTVVNPGDPAAPEVRPASGVTVMVTSADAQLITTSDAEGKLDIKVPPGDYVIAPVVPSAVRVYGSPARAFVHARGCAPVHFSLIANGRIEGRVVKSDGTPASRTPVDVVPANLPPGERPDNFTTSPSATTDQDGRFSVDAILPGQYVVAVNARATPRLSTPYATTYFPGVGREDAQVVEIGEGERKTGLTIVVSPLPEIMVSGVVVFDDDRPVLGASVTAAPADKKGDIIASVRADDGGAFELRLLAGIRYVVRAGIRTESGFRHTEAVVHVNPQLEALRLAIAR